VPYNTHHSFHEKEAHFCATKKASVFELTVSIYTGLFSPGKHRALFTKKRALHYKVAKTHRMP